MRQRKTAAVLLVTVFVGCGKKTDDAAASPAPLAASSDSKTTAAAIRQLYPVDCNAQAAWLSWTTCHDKTKGFDVVLKCTTEARDQAKANVDRLPGTSIASPATPCAGVIEAQSRRFVTTTAIYLEDVATWLTVNKTALARSLRTTTIQDLDNDKLKAEMPHEWDAKYGGDAAKGESLGFWWVSRVTCTKDLFRCGTKIDPSDPAYVECGVVATAIRLGVACGASSPFHHADGKAYCPSGICDLNNPNAWLYDRAAGQRIQ